MSSGNRYYQVTGWHPAGLHPGMVSGTLWEESHYWKQLHDIEARAAFLAEHAFPEGALERLAALGLTVDRLVLGRAKATAEAAKEEELEALRQNHFPELPSRRDCLFACETLSDLRRYANAHKLPRERAAVELELIPWDALNAQGMAPAGQPLPDLLAGGAPRVHKADPAWLDCNSAPPEARLEALTQYLRGQPRGIEPVYEVLIRGYFRITRVLDLYGEPG